jgi:hypothetical protein
MIVWGGSTAGRLFGDGAAFDPETGEWRVLPPGPLSARTGHTATWTGRELLIWGGCCDPRGHELGDGGAYDPELDRWRQMAPAPLLPRTAHTAVWTGSEMVVWGGQAANHAFNDGAEYDPARDRWRPLPDAPLAPRFGHSAVWTGDGMVVWGGATVQGELLADGALYRSGAWRRIPAAPAGRSDHKAVWVGNEMFVWGGCCSRAGKPLGDGLAFRPGHDWRSLPDSGLGPRQDHTVVSTGSVAIIWGGRAGLERSFDDGSVYGPTPQPWTPVPASPLSPRGAHSAVWTGRTMIVWGGCCVAGQEALSDGAELVIAFPETPPAPSPGALTTPTGVPAGGGGSRSLVGLAVAGAVAVLLAGILFTRRVRSPRG